MKLHLAEWVEEFGFGLAQIKTILAGGGVWLADGSELLLIGAVTRSVSEEWKMTAIQRGSVVSVVFLGVLIGNLISGFLGDLRGRRFPILLSYAMVFLCSLTSILSWNFTSLAALRLLVGIAFGVGQPAFNALGGELVPSGCRIYMTGFGQLMFVGGEVYSACLVAFDDVDMKHLHWRFLIGTGAIPGLLFGIYAYYKLYESPGFYLSQDRKPDAVKVLEDIRESNQSAPGVQKAAHKLVELVGGKPVSIPNPSLPSEMSEIPKDEPIDLDVPSSTSTSKSNRKSADICDQDADKAGFYLRMCQVLGPKYIITTIMLCYSAFTLNFLFYGGLYGFPQVLANMGDTLSVKPAINLILAALFEVPGMLLSMYIGARFQRKPALVLYLVATTLFTLSFIAGVSLVPSSNGSATNNGEEPITTVVQEPGGKIVSTEVEPHKHFGTSSGEMTAAAAAASSLFERRHLSKSRSRHTVLGNSADEPADDNTDSTDNNITTSYSKVYEDKITSTSTSSSNLNGSNDNKTIVQKVQQPSQQRSTNVIDKKLPPSNNKEPSSSNSSVVLSTPPNNIEDSSSNTVSQLPEPKSKWEEFLYGPDDENLDTNPILGNMLMLSRKHSDKVNPGGNPSFDLEILLHVGCFGMKLCVCLGFIIVYLYSIEIYPTYCRTTGTSLTLASGRIGSILCPLVYEYLALYNPMYFFVVMILLMIVNLLMLFILPLAETAGVALPEGGEEDTDGAEALKPVPYYKECFLRDRGQAPVPTTANLNNSSSPSVIKA